MATPITVSTQLTTMTRPTAVDKKTRSRRFNPGLDIGLLQLILGQWPIGDFKQWEAIAKRLGSVTPRGCRDRFHKLMAVYKANDIKSLKRGTGTEEECIERARLLGEAAKLELEMTRNIDGMRLEGNRMAVGNMLVDSNEPDDDSALEYKLQSTHKRNTVMAEYVQYLKTKAEREFALNIEKMAIERERFELERKEREAMIAHDANMMKLLLQTM